MENEIWKTISCAPLYEVSNFGRVRSLPRTYERPSRTGKIHVVNWEGGVINGRTRTTRGRPTCIIVSLRFEGRTIPYRVHRLVLEAFIGPCPDGMEGCHNDGNALNNELSNLRWDSHQANVNDMTTHGTKTKPPMHCGESHPNAKLSDNDIEIIRATPRGHGVRARLAREFNVSATTISRVWENIQRVFNGPPEINKQPRA